MYHIDAIISSSSPSSPSSASSSSCAQLSHTLVLVLKLSQQPAAHSVVMLTCDVGPLHDRASQLY
eukprot:3271653-Amphidinium_carterae.1